MKLEELLTSPIFGTFVDIEVSSIGLFYLPTPEIQIRCNNKKCNSLTWFKSDSYLPFLRDDDISKGFLSYKCKQCEEQIKEFAVVFGIGDEFTVSVAKLG